MPKTYIDLSKMPVENLYSLQQLMAEQYNKKTNNNLPLILPSGPPPEPFAQPNSPNTEQVQKVLTDSRDTTKYNKEKE